MLVCMAERIWGIMSLISKPGVRSGMNVVVAYFCFLISVIWACRAKIRSADLYACFGCCSLDR